MNIVVISHSFLESENQKNIIYLSKMENVQCIVPKTGSVNLWKNRVFQAETNSQNLFIAYKPTYITPSQYFLWTLSMGFISRKPDIINIAYNPWSLIFFQVWLYRTLFCPKAIIVCSIKKNTFVCKPGIFGAIKRWTAHQSHHFVDHVFAESKMVSDLFSEKLNYSRNRISIIKFLGVDVDNFVPCGDNEISGTKFKPLVVGYCGRFDAEKGIMDLVDALIEIQHEDKSPVILRLMGRGAYRDSLDDKIAMIAKEFEWLEVLPPVPNSQVKFFLQGIDVFVLPSRIMMDHQEHDAHILKEALASGIPCIGTKCGVIPEILGGGVGILVNPESVNELREAIGQLIKDFELRRGLSIRGRIIAKQEYSLNVIAQRKIKVFRELIDNE